jgi:hypothetical protein
MHIISIHKKEKIMLIAKHTVETTASPTAIWKIWEDVDQWKTWDHGIEFSTINGPFKTGTTGTLKPKGGPLVHTVLTVVESLKRFTDEAALPFTRIIVSHSLEEADGKTFVTHHIEMKGLLSFLFAFIIGRNMKKNLPQEMAAMVKKAESIR